MKRFVLIFLAISLLAFPMFAGALESSSYISRSQTGNKGGDFQFSTGVAELEGNNDRGQSSNSLYIAAQKQGYYSVGGEVVSYEVLPGQKLPVKQVPLNEGGYHVLLDPKGPSLGGCDGYGKLTQ